MSKILIVSDCHLPIPSVQGGAVPTLINIILKQNELQKAHKISVISVFNEKAKLESLKYKHSFFIFLKHSFIEKLIDQLIQKIVVLLNHSRKGRNLELLWKYKVILKTRNILKKNIYDAVFLENHGYLTRIFSKKCLLNKYDGKIYYHLHNDLPESIDYSVGSTQKFILISSYLSKKIINKFGPDACDRTQILKNCITCSDFEKELSDDEREDLKNKLGFKKNDIVVCFVGRICVEKGVSELLDAFSYINDLNIKLLIIGSTEFGNSVVSDFEINIRKKSKKLGNRVKLTGFVSHKDLWKYYQVSDIGVFPSMWEEPAGLTIIEAMASGLPVITTNSGGIPEYATCNSTILLDRDTNISKKIAKEILRISADLEHWKTNAKNAKFNVLKNYSEERYYKHFSELIG